MKLYYDDDMLIGDVIREDADAGANWQLIAQCGAAAMFEGFSGEAQLLVAWCEVDHGASIGATAVLSQVGRANEICTIPPAPVAHMGTESEALTEVVNAAVASVLAKR